MMPGRIVIVGAGPVGLGAAYRLQELGYRNFGIYDRNSYVGGLAASFRDRAGFTYDIGGHVMFSHYQYFDDLVDRMLGDGYSSLMRESWIWMNDRWIPYPLQNNIHRLPPDALLDCLHGLVDVHARHPAGAANFGEWVEAVFGAGIANRFMRPYNFKVWAHPLEMMSKEWISERVSVVDLKQVLTNVVHQRDELSWGPNNMFKYPLHGGTGGLYERFVPYIKNHLQLRREVVEIDLERRTIRLADGGNDRYDVLISAMPIPQLLSRLRPLPASLSEAARGLHNSHGLVVGVGIEGACPSGKCWAYFPEDSAPFYRVTYLSNYSPNIAPEGHFLLLTETSHSAHKQEARATIEQRVIDGLVATKLIQPGDRDRIVAVHTIEVDHFYPVPTLSRDRALAMIQPFLMQHRIYSRGRFGAWRYEISNMDHSVMQGVEVIDHILLGEPEKTWTPPPAAILSEVLAS
jgi:protoporphyrinogen oxidase